ncbi:S8 family serine peptidase, partial [Streptomonospora salina]|uniref:S8 family serine peptidase n=1 Tax=Streptomonospora salina TaxID=104205 RepID=UPI0035EF9163
MIRGNRAAARSATAAACAVALLAPQGAAAPAVADEHAGRELRPDQWGMEAVGAAEAAETDDGGGVTVALIGGGVDTSHPDVSEAAARGGDFTDDGGSGPDATATPLAGIIAGRGHGQEYTGGVVGVAPGADVLSVRVPTGTGRQAAAALADGIRHAADKGVQVLVLPAGSASAEPDASVQAAVGYARSNNAVVVAPAGEGGDAYPGAYDGVLAVGAVGEDLVPTADSPASGAALVAPGAGVPAPAPGGGYAPVDGAAAAAAVAAAAPALLARY